jgi:hypothetical protein
MTSLPSFPFFFFSHFSFLFFFYLVSRMLAFFNSFFFLLLSFLFGLLQNNFFLFFFFSFGIRSSVLDRDVLEPTDQNVLGFPVSLQFHIKMLFSLNDLQNTKTPKLIKKSENNKGKGLVYAN